MTVLSALNLQRYRSSTHRTRLNLAVYSANAIWQAAITVTPAQGATAITVAAPVVIRAPDEHFLVMFGSVAGLGDIGTARFRSYSAPTLTVDANNVALTAGNVATVVDEIKPDAIHPTMDDSDVTFENGDTGYHDSLNVQYSPLARITCPAVAYRNETTGIATVAFYSDSLAMAVGAAITGHAWNFRDGVVQGTGLSTSAIAGTIANPILVDFSSSGARYIQYTVTDSNGKTHTRYEVVFIFDKHTGTLPYRQIEMRGLEGDVESGVWSAELIVYSDATLDYFPAGARVVLFADDYFGDEQIAIGNIPWRENIVFSGYIRRGSVRKNWATGAVEFEVESISGVMQNLWQLANGLETTAGAPADWHVLNNMTYSLAAHHVLTQHSTVSEICDVHPDWPSYSSEYVDLADTSLLEVLRQIGGAVRGRVGCSKEGVLYLEANPQLLPLASRSASYVLSTTFADFRDEIQFGEDKSEKDVSQVDFCGEDALHDPLYSLAPATPWGSGQSDRVDGIRVTGQVQCNEFAGLFEGYRNNPFRDVTLPWRGNYRVMDIFPAEPIAVSIAANQNKRGLVWTNQRCWTKRVSLEYQPGILLLTSVVEKDSYGYPGITNEYPNTEPPIPPFPDPLPIEPPIVEPPEPPVTVIDGKGNLLYASTLKGVARCDNAYGTDGTDGAPIWTNISTGLVGDGLKVRAINFDPYSRVGDHFTAMWATTDDGIWYCTGLPNAPVWTQQYSLAQIQAVFGATAHLGYGFSPSVRRDGEAVFYVLKYRTTGMAGYWYVYPLYTRDHGATWNFDVSKWLLIGQTAIVEYDSCGPYCSYTTNDTYYMAGGFVASWEYPGDFPRPSNRFVIALRATGTPQEFHPYMCHPTPFADPNWILMSQPYANNAGVAYTDDLRMYMMSIASYSGVNVFYKYTSFGTPAYPVDPPPAKTDVGDADMKYGNSFPRGPHRLIVHMMNEDRMYAFGFQGGVGAVNNFFSSINGGAAWTGRSLFGGGNLIRNLWTAPSLADVVFVIGDLAVNGGVQMSIDAGANWTDIDSAGFRALFPGIVAGDMERSFVLIDYNFV